MAKNDAGVERYVWSVQGQEGVRLLIRLRTGSAGLLRCKMIIGEGVVMYIVVLEKMWSIYWCVWGICEELVGTGG